jgi:hypothetical protein
MTVRSDARRETERIRVGSSALREGRRDRMETTTRQREPLRLPAQAQPRRGNSSAGADWGPASSQRAGTIGPGAARPARVRPASAPPRWDRPVQPRLTGRRPASAQAVRTDRRGETGRAASLPRVPFVLLVLVLLGGGLICLLVINTTLGATSFRISKLQSTGATLATQEQALQQQIAAEQAPAEIAKRAYQLGMRVQATGSIVDLRTERVYQLPGQSGATTPLGAPSTSPTAASTASAQQPAKSATVAPSPSKSGSTARTAKTSHRSGSGR